MADIRSTIEPKSDQQNFDDFVGGMSKTIKITNVTVVPGDQPVSIHFEGDNGKPYKPGKSMRRVLIHIWGADANNYIGRRLTIYGDEKVVFGGLAVGGIRISHMSHIDKDITMALTATRANRKPFTVKPLAVLDATISKEQQTALIAAITEAGILPADFLARFGIKKTAELLESKLEEVRAWVNTAKDNKPVICAECQKAGGGHSASCPNAEPE